MIRSAAPRKVTCVAVGVLVRDDGSVLLADRPSGKPYAGYWEFPGGKVEPGEPVATALKRELHEELGIDIETSDPWVTFEFDYPHAYVRLHFHRVHRWRGSPHPREGQRLQFVHPERELPQPLLPAAVPTLRWLRLPETVLVVSPGSAVPTGIGGRDGRCVSSKSPLVVVEADWQARTCADVIAQWRHFTSSLNGLLLAAGPGAHDVTGVDGAVLERGALAATGHQGTAAWLGLWIDRLDDMQAGLRHQCDFVLVRPSIATRLAHEQEAPLPAYFSVGIPPMSDSSLVPACGHGLWRDLRTQPRMTGWSTAGGCSRVRTH